MPASEWFVGDINESMLEFSRNGIPYPKMAPFAQSLVSNQDWPRLAHLIDGMDLSEEWGLENLYLGEPDEAEKNYVLDKNKKIRSSYGNFPNIKPGLATLFERPIDRKKKWQSLVREKERRIGFPLTKERYNTQFRRKGSEDPRFQPGRAI
jgi:hypothetical protein